MCLKRRVGKGATSRRAHLHHLSRVGGHAALCPPYFANGTVAREVLVDCDDKRRRLVYAIKSERLTQHSASAQVFPEGEARTRFVWIADVLPHEFATYMEGQMELGLAAMQKSLGRKAA
jgi:hypothetical protein